MGSDSGHQARTKRRHGSVDHLKTQTDAEKNRVTDERGEYTLSLFSVCTEQIEQTGSQTVKPSTFKIKHLVHYVVTWRSTRHYETLSVTRPVRGSVAQQMHVGVFKRLWVQVPPEVTVSNKQQTFELVGCAHY